MNSSQRQRLSTLMQAYSRSLPDKIAAIEELWEQYRLSPGDRGLLERIHDCCHRLAGSGGSFGFAALSERAREMEMLVLELLGSTAQTPDIPLSKVRGLIGAIRHATGEQAPGGGEEAAQPPHAP